MKKTTLTLGSAFIASATLALSAHAGETFSSNSLSQGYQVASADGKSADAKCGASKASEAACGASKAKDGKCGAGMMKDKDGNCGSAKAHHGKAKHHKAAAKAASMPAAKASS
jgi:uncharacterized low-complexity protein